MRLQKSLKHDLVIKQQKKVGLECGVSFSCTASESVKCIYPFFFRFVSHRGRKQTYGYPVSKGRINWEIRIGICTLLYIK